MTEEQKNCEYCHAADMFSGGFDFGENDWFMVRCVGDAYYIIACTAPGDDELESEAINYCPMCGRKLKEDRNV